MRTARPNGFTLVELMVVTAIVSVITALAVGSYSGIAELNAPQNAAYDLSATLSRARARAAERGANVWVVIWPNRSRDGSTGAGAYAMYEDADGLKMNNFTAPGTLGNGANTTRNRQLDVQFLQGYPKSNVKFGAPGNTSDTSFTGLQLDTKTAVDASAKATVVSALASANGCNFCSGSGAGQVGAIVFTPEGEARFVNGSGAYVTPSGGGQLMMVDKDAKRRAFFFKIYSATSYVSFFSN